MTAVAACLLVMLALQLITPYWWWTMIVPFAFGAATAKSGGRALGTGFLAAGLLWFGGAGYFYLTGSRIIAARMAGMFGFGRSWLMILLTALLAAAAAAVSGYAGYAVRACFKRTTAVRKGRGA